MIANFCIRTIRTRLPHFTDVLQTFAIANVCIRKFRTRLPHFTDVFRTFARKSVQRLHLARTEDCYRPRAENVPYGIRSPSRCITASRPSCARRRNRPRAPMGGFIDGRVLQCVRMGASPLAGIALPPMQTKPFSAFYVVNVLCRLKLSYNTFLTGLVVHASIRY